MKKTDEDNQTLGYMKAIRRNKVVVVDDELHEKTLLPHLDEIRNKKNFPSNKWKALKDLILQEIKNIDKDTTWTPMEPGWWLEMMEVRKKLQNSDICNYCGESFKKGNNHSKCG